MSDFKRAPISGLAGQLLRAGVAQFFRDNPGAVAIYDEHARPVVEEALERVLPDEPLGLVDIADRIGIMPPKKNGGRRGVR